MQTLNLASPLAQVSGEATAMAHLAVRLASLTAQLEAAVFERDLAQQAQARLAQAYGVLAERPPTPPPDLIQELALTRRQRAQLEQEVHLLRQQRDRLETDCVHWHAERDRWEADCVYWRAECDRLAVAQQLLLQNAAGLDAEALDLHSYAVSLKQSLVVVQKSRRWRFTQAITKLWGRHWK